MSGLFMLEASGIPIERPLFRPISTSKQDMPVSRVFISVFVIIHLSIRNMLVCPVLALPDQKRSYPDQANAYNPKPA